ncbi:MAG: LysM peptidoglycan-binding domain-containing protein [Desulfobacteraceae bacterium]|nr:LysM peptidoglycan-binding domain-containing protein [Desulfobacteraceae bacterium]MCF8095048.1 LysM peptidoglycan-binding domain-containing protein [Desulfobacteraceae bacterium]
MTDFERDDDKSEGFEEAPRSYLRRQSRTTGKRLKILPLALLGAAVVVLLAAGVLVLVSGNDEPAREVSNKKTLEIGKAESLPEAPSRQNVGSESGTGFGPEEFKSMQSALNDLESRMNENHEQVMGRLAELAKRVVENTEQARESLKMMEKLQAGMEKLESRYQSIQAGAQTKTASETSTKTRTVSNTKKKTAGSDSGQAKDSYYTVKKNDTLYSIAKDNGIKLETLLEINGFDRNSVIHPGDRLKITP